METSFRGGYVSGEAFATESTSSVVAQWHACGTTRVGLGSLRLFVCFDNWQ